VVRAILRVSDRVHAEVLAELRGRGITSLKTDVVFGTAERRE
jgi:hypothetical protein